MTRPPLLSATRIYVKEYGAGVLAAGLVYGGISQIIGVLTDTLAIGVTGLVNAIIRQGFHGRSELGHFGEMPWVFYARVAAIGVIVVVMGFLVGLWGNSRSQRQLTRERLPEIQK